MVSIHRHRGLLPLALQELWLTFDRARANATCLTHEQSTQQLTQQIFDWLFGDREILLQFLNPRNTGQVSYYELETNACHTLELLTSTPEDQATVPRLITLFRSIYPISSNQ